MADVESGHRRGILLVISSPSGAGKTTLARAVAQAERLEFWVSYTTRSPRQGERDGVDYKFVTDDEFSQMVERKEFAEWAVVHGRRYGTAVHTVNRALEDGKDYLFDIDYQGGAQIRRQWPEESVLVFILPPSMAELERRLRRRATDSHEAIERRLAMATRELEHYGEYDYLVVNDNLETALKELTSIYVAARCARARTAHLGQALLVEARTNETRPHETRPGDGRQHPKTDEGGWPPNTQ
jgi:guanylate kinase